MTKQQIIDNWLGLVIEQLMDEGLDDHADLVRDCGAILAVVLEHGVPLADLRRCCMHEGGIAVTPLGDVLDQLQLNKMAD